MLLQSGWNDDLFPADEALRLYERTRAQFPGDPISLFLADYGHSRSQNKAADVATFNARLEAWFAHYLKGEGAAPSSSVEALTTTCPKSAASEGPFRAADWSGLQPGEIRFSSADSQTIGHRSFSEEQKPTTSSGAFDPIVGTKTPCTELPAAAVANPQAATYDLVAAPGGGYTLMGSPTIIATVQAPSPNSEIAARLLDVSPEGNERLVARGLYRPVGGRQQMIFQLHPQGYHFAAGHVARLELLPSDFPYGRFSNLQTDITVSSLEMRLPVIQQPGALGGLVQEPAPKVVPAGYTLAPEFVQKATPEEGGGPPPTPAPTPTPVKIGEGGLVGRFNAYRKAAFTPVHCAGEGPCSGQISITIGRLHKKGRLTLAAGGYSLPHGATKWIRMPLTKGGRKVIKLRLRNRQGARSVPGVVRFEDSGRPRRILKRPIHVPKGH